MCQRRKPTKDNTVTKRIWACRSYNGHISIEQLSNKMSNPKILGGFGQCWASSSIQNMTWGHKMKSSYKRQPLTRHYVANLMVKSVGLQVFFWLFRLGFTLNLLDAWQRKAGWRRWRETEGESFLCTVLFLGWKMDANQIVKQRALHTEITQWEWLLFEW